MKAAITLLVLAVSFAADCAAASNWTMFAANPQHTGEVKAEKRLNKRSAGKLKLHWKARLDNTAKELTSLLVPVAVTDVKGSSRAKNYLIVAGSDDNVFALNADNGAVLWRRHFAVTAKPKQAPDWLCPNALTATPVIDRQRRLVYALASDGQLYTLGVVTGEDAQPPRQMIPAFAKTWSLTLTNGVIYTATSQACNGVRSAIYAMSADEGAPREFLAMRTYGAGIWGRAGVSIGSDNTVFAETGDGAFDAQKGQYANTILAVNGTTLQLKDYFTPANHAYIFKKDLDLGNMTPVVFRYGSKELIAASGKEGVIYLLDTSCLGGDDHATPLFKSDLYANAAGSYYGRGFWGALSARSGEKGVQWLYAPAWGPATEQTKFKITYGDAPSGSVMAFQVTGPDTHPVLTPVWRSTDMAVPEPVAIANGVVFALSNGENVTQNDANGRLLKSEFRASHPAGHAVLYALDGDTGAVLYSSGDAISSFTHFGGLAIAGGQVFVSAWDGTVYAFSTR